MAEWDLTKIAQREWEPLGSQRISAWRTYMAPDGHPSVVEEPPEVTDDMLDRAIAAYYSYGTVEDEGDFQGAMREALAAALSEEQA
jgi:hypothetical protein